MVQKQELEKILRQKFDKLLQDRHNVEEAVVKFVKVFYKEDLKYIEDVFIVVFREFGIK